MPFISKDKKAIPGHFYSGKEGPDDHPRFNYIDKHGNNIRYTNAPVGHADNISHFGESAPHPGEPLFESNPEFFTPDGRKLSRAPIDPNHVEWNQQYHPDSKRNLWAGRWVNPVSGEHEYTYLDKDIKNNPKLRIYFQNCLVDARLPYFREYVSNLFNSQMLKDQIVAITLALLDQGRYGVEELMTVSPSKVTVMGNLVKFNKRWIMGDYRLITAIESLKSSHHPDSSFFSVPKVKKDGEIDESVLRIIGPHYMYNVIDGHGMSLEGLFTYHATHTFSREVERLLARQPCAWPVAMAYGLEAVAAEIGYDLEHHPNKFKALLAIQEKLIDPIVIKILELNAKAAGAVNTDMSDIPPAPPTVSPVSIELTQRTPHEEAFSRFLHKLDVHNYI